MRIVFSDDGRDFLRRDWTHLAEEDPSGTFFHRPAYLKLYWEEFGETPEHLLLGFAEQDDGTLSAAVAFERVGDVLRFLGGTEVTDYMGPVGLPSMREQTAQALLDGAPAIATIGRAPTSAACGRTTRGWPRCAARPPDAGLEVEETEDQNGVAPFLALPATWDAYLAGLPSKLRHEIKRKATKLETETGPFRIVAADAETARAAARPVRGAASAERGSEGRVHGARHGDLLPAARGGVPAGRDLPAHVHRGRRRARRGHDRLRRRGHVLALQLRVRPTLGGRSRPAWSWWRRTSGSRSRRAAPPSIS